jgi:diguanylate cyclase (GGDEF)-like protein
MDAQVATDGLDELTKLPGRGLFFQRAMTAFDSAREGGDECCAALIDLDRLDLVNEVYGHHVGTELIRETAAALEAIAKDGDVIGRIGGDEFALLRIGGTTTADELWLQISTIAKAASGGDKPFALDASVGVAVARADEVDSLDEMMWLADEAMYEHKVEYGGEQGAPHARRRARN